MIEAQGGDASAIDDRSRLPTARLRTPVVAELDGTLAALDALTVARASIILGAGRERKGDPIDLAVGIELLARVGDPLQRGQPLAIIHANDESRIPEAERLLHEAARISASPVPPQPLILERLGS
jgi:thymidine phosphorylase